MNTLTEKEKQAVEEAVSLLAGASDDKFANSSKKYDSYDLREMFIQGAEYLAELRAPSEKRTLENGGLIYIETLGLIENSHWKAKVEAPSEEIGVEHHYVDQSKPIEFAIHIGDDEQVEKFLASKAKNMATVDLNDNPYTDKA